MKSGKLYIVVALATIAMLMLLSGEMFADGSNSESQSGAGAEQLPVDWEAARKHPLLEMSRLSEKQQKAARDSAVPVLLPDREALLRSALITTGPGWYAASMAEGQATITISGNSRVIRIEGIPEPPPLGDPNLKAGAGEGRLEVNFKAFGIYYDISVECYDGAKDPHCADERFVMQLMDSLKLAHGDHQ
jgi:hypothetical protein